MITLIHILADVTVEESDLTSLPKGTFTGENVLQTWQLVFGILGAIALLVIMVAAFQYVISQGEPQSTAKAKNTILYALIGLAICVLGGTIVSFVVGNL